MTPKNKAKELVRKMYGCEINTDLNDIYIINGDGYFIAKDSALIAVNEVINELDDNFDSLHCSDRKEFWRKVKQEIEKL